MSDRKLGKLVIGERVDVKVRDDFDETYTTSVEVVEVHRSMGAFTGRSYDGNSRMIDASHIV